MSSLELQLPSSRMKTLVVAGTGYQPPPGRIESEKGRLLVLDDHNREGAKSLKITLAVELSGCVFSVAATQGTIAAAVNSYVSTSDLSSWAPITIYF